MSSSQVMSEKKELTIVLSQFLANTYVLYTKTQNFHWNVTGPRFHSLHLLFEEQYLDLAAAIDAIAERIRMIGARPHGSMKAFLSLTTFEEGSSTLSEDAMLKQLYEDHSAMAELLRKWIEIASHDGDEGTADLFIQRLRVHEKFAWMLKSHLS